LTNIAIIEKNTFYRESLKIVLNQIDDFNVVFDTDNILPLFQIADIQSIQILLLDYDFYENENLIKIEQFSPSIKLLILSNYSENYFFDKHKERGLNFISKCSTKFLFEQKIRKSLNLNIICNI
jgi:DNA-binding NarL/FixJ family response regulator